MRRGKPVGIKAEADKAAAQVATIKRVVVYKRTGVEVPMKAGRDVYFHDWIAGQPDQAQTEVMEAEDTCMVIYTSGTTGKPKGTVHTHAGVIAQVAKEVGYACDLKSTDVFFWPTDIGWMMGPWLFIGSQFHRAPYLIYEGTPNWPEPDRLWNVVEAHKVTHFGISPTAIRLMKAQPDEVVEKHDFSRLRLMASSGEPWDPEAYMWFFEKVGGKRCPIINISGGTEIMGCLLQPYPIHPLKPCTLQGPALAMDIDVFDEDGKSIKGGIGHLVCKKPGPSMTKSFLNDDKRYLETYFSRFPGVWYHGDWAHIDEDGYWFLHGRSDDTIKIAGKRTGPAEIESAANEHPDVQESAAIGVHHELKGEAVVCFVVVKPGRTASEKLREDVSKLIVEKLGKTLKPDKVLFVAALPKTRSGKIVRGSIKKKFIGESPGDLSSVENPDAIEEIAKAK
jgi:acetyl-CoA synthetase